MNFSLSSQRQELQLLEELVLRSDAETSRHARNDYSSTPPTMYQCRICRQSRCRSRAAIGGEIMMINAIPLTSETILSAGGDAVLRIFEQQSLAAACLVVPSCSARCVNISNSASVKLIVMERGSGRLYVRQYPGGTVGDVYEDQ
jgi:hypothetical protein